MSAGYNCAIEAGYYKLICETGKKIRRDAR
jgi:hypothetical protein